jgi:hypothetical protein
MVEGVSLRMEPRVLFDPVQRKQSNPIDSEPVEMLGQDERIGPIFGLGHLRRGAGIASAARPPEQDELLADLAVGRKVSRSQAMAKHGCRLAFGHVIVILSRRFEPVERVRFVL